MDIIAEMNSTLQELIPGQVGRYDDSFNINCVGDSFQSFNVPTILFEAGHFENDYDRDLTRFYIYSSYISAFNYISKGFVSGDSYEDYLKIPENDKCFYDVIIRYANVGSEEEPEILDVAVLFVEKLINRKIAFFARIEVIALLPNYYGHKEINANKMRVLGEDGSDLKVGFENDFVTIGDDKFLLKL